MDLYEREKLLGEGGFGKVYRGVHKETGKHVAIKTIDLTDYCKIKSHFVICLFSKGC
jgi:hypothetical protein